MEPSGYGIDGAVRYWPPVPEDYLIAPEIELDAHTFHFEAAEDIENIFHSDGETPPPKDTGTWFQLAEFQVASIGKSQPVRHHPSHGEGSRKCTVYQRQLLIRRVVHRQAEVRKIQLFHYRGNWKMSNQTPASRAHFLHLLEVVIMERGLGPALVHCVDGATRSGLFLASYLLAERITRDHFVDLFHTLKALKLRRRAAVISAVS